MSRYNSYYPGSMPPVRDRRQPRSGRYDPLMAQAAAAAAAVNPELQGMPVAMAYVPWQVWGEVYDCETALARGTVFPVLDLPFMAYRGASV